MHSIQEWQEFFERKGVVRNRRLEETLEEIAALNRSKVPVILDFEHLSLLLGVDKVYLASAVNSSGSHWRSFRLKKRSGGYRDIDVPYPALLNIQRWIYLNILLKIPVSGYCHSFRKSRSIVTNASWHVGQREILKLDLTDFFPSIGINRIIALFHSLGYNKKVSFYLAALCCHDKKLPQGAPTSPYLSNLVVRPMDYRIMRYARKCSLNYTRYADDLIFSGDDISQSVIKGVTEIIEDKGFRVNMEKTRLYRNSRKRIVTGINVTDRLSIPRENKRKIKQEIYYIRKFGLIEHLRRTKINRQKYCSSLLGRICFWLQVEPDNSFAQKAKTHILQLMRNGFKEV